MQSQANHTDAGRYKVARGVKVNRDIGRVLEFDDSDELSVWDGDECNRFRGTDTTIFAPLMKPEEGLWSFAADLCRSLGAEYEKKTKYAGIPAYYYTIDLGDPKVMRTVTKFLTILQNESQINFIFLRTIQSCIVFAETIQTTVHLKALWISLCAMRHR